MGTIRIIVGGFIFLIGILAFLQLMEETMPTPRNPPPPQPVVLDQSNLVRLGVIAVTIGIGGGILGWGIRS